MRETQRCPSFVAAMLGIALPCLPSSTRKAARNFPEASNLWMRRDPYSAT